MFKKHHNVIYWATKFHNNNSGNVQLSCVIPPHTHLLTPTPAFFNLLTQPKEKREKGGGGDRLETDLLI